MVCVFLVVVVFHRFSHSKEPSVFMHGIFFSCNFPLPLCIIITTISAAVWKAKHFYTHKRTCLAIKMHRQKRVRCSKFDWRLLNSVKSPKSIAANVHDGTCLVFPCCVVHCFVPFGYRRERCLPKKNLI